MEAYKYGSNQKGMEGHDGTPPTFYPCERGASCTSPESSISSIGSDFVFIFSFFSLINILTFQERPHQTSFLHITKDWRAPPSSCQIKVHVLLQHHILIPLWVTTFDWKKTRIYCTTFIISRGFDGRMGKCAQIKLHISHFWSH